MKNTPETRVVIKRAVRRTLKTLVPRLFPNSEVPKVEIKGDQIHVSFVMPLSWWEHAADD